MEIKEQFIDEICRLSKANDGKATLIQKLKDIIKNEIDRNDIFNILNSIDKFIWIHGLSDDELNFFEINDYAIKKLLYDKEVFLSLTPLDIISYVKEDKFKRILYQIIENGELRYEMVFRKKGGDKIPLSLNSYIIDYSGKKAVLTIGDEYAGLNTSAGKALMLGKIMETTDAAVIGLDLEGNIQYWNKAACSTFDYSENEINGWHFTTLIESESKEEFYELFDKVKSGEKGVRSECYAVKKDNIRIYISLTFSQFDDDMGFVRGISLIARDISDRKEAQDELARSKEQIRKSSKHIEAAREKERKIIALEVHDGLGQALTALTLDLSWLKKKLLSENPEVLKKLDSMSMLIDNTAETVSSIASQLRPSVLDHFGFVSAIEWQAEDFKTRTGIDYSFSAEEEAINLEEQRSIVVLRVFQEILTNIIRHAKATMVNISLKLIDDVVFLEVSDNGIGIELENINSPDSYGLLGIYERIKAYNGSFNIKGKKGKGTKARISLPIKDED